MPYVYNVGQNFRWNMIQSSTATPFFAEGGTIYASSDGGANWGKVTPNASYFANSTGINYFISYPDGQPFYLNPEYNTWEPLPKISLSSIMPGINGSFVIGIESSSSDLVLYNKGSAKWDVLKSDCKSIYYDYHFDTYCVICGEENTLYYVSSPGILNIVRSNVKCVSSVSGIFYIVDSNTNEIFQIELFPNYSEIFVGNNGGMLAGTNTNIYNLDQNSSIVYCYTGSSDVWEPVANEAAYISACSSCQSLTLVNSESNSLWLYTDTPWDWRLIKENIIIGGVTWGNKIYCIVEEKPLLTHAELNNIIENYAPILYFNSGEKYFMCNVSYFLENCWIIDLKNPDKKTQANLSNLPQGQSNASNYQLVEKDTSVRGGNINSAVSYVHVLELEDVLEIQFWFLYGYNGAGFGKIECKVAGHGYDTGNFSLAPMGEHEGDWEGVTLRFDLERLKATGAISAKPTMVGFCQHGNRQWIDYENVERSGKQIVVYPSLYGHASYPQAGDFTHDKHGIDNVGITLLFEIVDQADKGPVSFNCAHPGNFQVVSASCLGAERPMEPEWLNFWGRWGASNKVPPTDLILDNIFRENPSLPEGLLRSLLKAELNAALPTAWTEEQDGPRSLKNQSQWNGIH